MQKLYCYVDETGQDTQGDLFIVSVIVTEEEREELSKQLEEIEETSGKGKVKWHGANDRARISYIHAVLENPAFNGKLTYCCSRNTVNYFTGTVLATARAIIAKAQKSYQATVFVDGLQHSQVKRFGTELRHLRIRTRKIRGVRKEETEPLIRLADAVCGFVRSAGEGRENLNKLLQKEKARGVIVEL